MTSFMIISYDFNEKMFDKHLQDAEISRWKMAKSYKPNYSLQANDQKLSTTQSWNLGPQDTYP